MKYFLRSITVGHLKALLFILYRRDCGVHFHAFGWQNVATEAHFIFFANFSFINSDDKRADEGPTFETSARNS